MLGTLAAADTDAALAYAECQAKHAGAVKAYDAVYRAWKAAKKGQAKQK